MKRLFLLVCLVVAQPASAETVFEPSLLGALGYANRSGTGEEGSFFADGGLGLPFRRTNETSTLQLQLRAYYRWFLEEGGRDNLNFWLNSSYSKRLTARDRLSFQVSLTQRQQPEELPADEPDPTFQGGVRRRSASGSVSHRHQLNSTVGVFGQLLFLGTEFDLPPESGQADERDEWSLGLGVTKRLSPNSSLSPFYRFRFFDFEEAVDQRSHSLGVGYQHQIALRTSLSGNLGGWYLEQAEATSSRSRSQSGFFGSLQASHDLEAVRIGGTVSHGLNAQSALGRVGEVTRVLVSVANRAPGRIDWISSAAWSTRDEVFEQDRSAVQTLRIGAGAGYRASRRISLRAAASWNRRLRPDLGRPDYWQARVGVAWTPLGSLQLGPLGRLDDVISDPFEPFEP